VSGEPEHDDAPPAPKLPEVESPPPEDVLDAVPTAGEIVEHAQSADEVVEGQPSVEEILGADRRGDAPPAS
jgi:hypothetical protein